MSNRLHHSPADLRSPGALVALTGDLDLATLPGFEEGMTAPPYRDPNAPLVIDLRALDHINTVGLASLVRMAQRLQPRRRTLAVLVRPHSQVERSLYVGRLHRLMDVVHAPAELAPGAAPAVLPAGMPAEPASA